MFRIIVTVIFLIAITILIVMNVGSTSDVNVFGWKLEQLSVAVVAIVSFVAGVIYSFVFYLISYLERGRRERLAKRKKKLKDQATDLKNREQEVGDLAEESRQQLETAKKMQEPVDTPNAGRARRAMAGLFGSRKSDKTRANVTKPDST